MTSISRRYPIQTAFDLQNGAFNQSRTRRLSALFTLFVLLFVMILTAAAAFTMAAERKDLESQTATATAELARLTGTYQEATMVNGIPADRHLELVQTLSGIAAEAATYDVDMFQVYDDILKVAPAGFTITTLAVVFQQVAAPTTTTTTTAPATADTDPAAVAPTVNRETGPEMQMHVTITGQALTYRAVRELADALKTIVYVSDVSVTWDANEPPLVATAELTLTGFPLQRQATYQADHDAAQNPDTSQSTPETTPVSTSTTSEGN